MKFKKNPKGGGQSSHRTAKTAALIVLTMVFAMVLCGAVSAENVTNDTVDGTTTYTTSDSGTSNTSETGSDCLPTVAHGTINGEVYISSTAGWPGSNPDNFEVPEGTVVYARYYVGVWSALANTTFNGNELSAEGTYVSGMGVTWIAYDVTDYVIAGALNTATSSSYGGDGRQYGNTLVVVLQNDDDPYIEYWITEGMDWLVGENAWSYTTLEGTVDLSFVQTASLYSVLLTGYGSENLNGNALPTATEYVGGGYFDALRWDDIQDLLVAENQSVNVLGDGGYSSVVFHALTIEYITYDLVPVSLTPNVVTPNTSNTLTATIENSGNTDSSAFDVALLVDGTVVDTHSVTSLASGSSTTVDFQWTPDGTKDKYTLTISVDPENAVNESDETNNTLTTLVGSTSAPTPVAEFTATPTTDDAPLTVQFTDQSSDSAISWAWDFDNDGTVDSTEQNPTYTYETPGTYTIKLTIVNGSGSDDEIKTDYITVNTPVTPVTDFTATPTSDVPPLTVQFTDTSTNNPRTWAWDFNDDGIIDSTEQNPTYNYDTPGKYTVKLTTSNGAGSDSETKTDYITVLAAPIADFTATPTAGGSPLTVQFTDTSTNYPTSWAWDFDNDGIIDSTEQNPTYTYTALGNYTVKLTVTNSVGSDDETKTDYITVTTAPVADFTATPTSGVTSVTVQFTDTSANDPTSWAWDFDNNGTVDSTEQNPTHTYSTPGKYTVKLTISNGAGSDSETKTDYITVLEGPVASFTATPTAGGSPLTVQFTDTSANYPTSWAWDFDNDGIIDSTEQNPTYTYTTVGKYSVKLTVTNSVGSNDKTKTDYITVSIPPVADFTATPTTGMYPLTVQFTDTSINSPTSWAWDFNNDGVTDSTKQNPTYTYSSVGIYTVKLTATNAAGSDYETKTDYINVTNSTPPVADFTATPTLGDSPLTVQLTDQSTDGSTELITKKTASMGTFDLYPDDCLTASWNFSQTVDLTGVDSITFYYKAWWETDGWLCGSTLEKLSIGSDVVWQVSNAYQTSWNLVTVDVSSYTGLQTITFTHSMIGFCGPGGAALYLKDISALKTENITSWLWDFGDGTNSTEQNPTHTYTTGGPYNVSLTVTSDVGNDSEEKTDYILVDPYDLTVTDLDSVQSTVFPGESNTVTFTVANNGTYTATDVLVNLYASDVDDGTTPVASTAIDSLASGATTTVTLIDPTIRPITSNTSNGSELSYVNYTATADPDDTIPETDETNNSMTSAALPIYYNGYKGKRYEYNGEDAASSETNTSGDINTEHVYDLKGDVIYSSGDSAYHGTNWTTSTTTWTTTDLTLPSTANVVDAWLYVPYNWDSTSDGDPNWILTFNGVEIVPVGWYTDQKNFGTSYSTYKYGLYVYNVSNLLNTTGDNTLVINPLAGNSNAIYPSTLVVVYSDTNSTRKQIFINEQCDELLPGTNYGVTTEEATAYAPFTGLNIDTSLITNATLHSFAGSAGADEGNLIWNDTTLATNAWQGDAYTASALVYDVTDHLGTDNTAGIQGTSTSGMVALQQILVVEYDTIAPTVSADPVSGYYNAAQNVTLTAVDNLSTSLEIYYTTNGQTPSSYSTLYTEPISITADTTLKFIAIDDAGNISSVQCETYIMDTTLPTVTADPVAGLYNNTQTVTLTATDNLDTNLDIYYTLDGTTPTTTSTLYTSPLTIDATTTLMFIAVDDAGNLSYVQTEVYTIDTGVPVVSSNIGTGVFGDSQTVILTATDNLDTNPDIYYTTDGTTPTTTSTLYSGPIIIDTTTVLRFFAVDDAGNASPVETRTYVIDTEAPAVTADPVGGVYNATFDVVLSVEDNTDAHPTIYYTTDGTIPTTSSTQYTGAITISGDTNLQFITMDFFGNTSSVQSETYIIDTEAPAVAADISTGLFNATQNVTLTATDNLDTQPDIYYTTDGTTPTMGSTLYSGPITIDVTTSLMFFAVDDAGNMSGVQTEVYTIDMEAPNVTADPAGVSFNTSKTVALAAMDNLDINPDIYYTTDGTTPTMGSILYSGPITVDATTMLMFIAVDDAGNLSDVQSKIYTLDTEAPGVSASMGSGMLGSGESVTLNATDNEDTSPDIYYTTDGTTPTTSSTLYTGPISLDETMVLNFFAVDEAGNASQVESRTYTIDAEAPTVTANPASGIYNTASVVLTATDNMDANPTIYYTTDGTTPTTSSTLYAGPISITVDTTLQFIAVDILGNTSLVQSETYTISTDTTAPTIVTVDPSNGTTSIAGDAIFTVTFSEDIVEGTGWIELVDSSGTAIPFTTSISGNVLTITPTSDLGESSYKLMIHTGSVTDLAGNLLAGKSFRFSVGTAPTITATSPVDGATNVSVAKTLTVTFSEAIRKSSSFWVELVDSTGAAVNYTSYITSGNVLVINPVDDLAANTTYQLKLHTGCVTDLAGNLLAAKIISFSTRST